MTLKTKNRELEKALKIIKLMEDKANKDEISKCVTCDKLFESKKGSRGKSEKKKRTWWQWSKSKGNESISK